MDSCSPCWPVLSSDNLEDPRYRGYCFRYVIPFPYWCMIQHEMMRELHTDQLRPINTQRGFATGQHEVPEVFCCPGLNWCCLPSVVPYLTCCVGLAMNRSAMREATGIKPDFLMDLIMYTCCGCLLMMRDTALVSPPTPRAGSDFETDWDSCAQTKYYNQPCNFLTCVWVVCCPFPAYCCVQAWTTALAEQAENRCGEFVAAWMRAMCCACYGCALNRRKIRKARGHSEYFCTDLIRFGVGGCACLVMQEFLEKRDGNVAGGPTNISVQPFGEVPRQVEESVPLQ